jgi:prepilin-type N-terminal cleavage/methylation domain-containing protein
MQRSRQSDLFRRYDVRPWRRVARCRAFTLIELIFVLALLAIAAIFVASNMSGFFRGRALNSEARRMLSLAHYGQSRAISEGMPVVLWLNPQNSTYGLSVHASFKGDEEDTRAVTYAVDSNLTLEVPVEHVVPTSERDDEKLGMADGVSFIRFNPDGFFDEASVSRITLRLGNDAGLELVPTANRLAYEIRPLTLN